MVIKLLTGFIGSGKSYAAVKVGTSIADAPLGKKYVIANFPIKPKKKMFARFRKEKFNNPRWIYKTNEELTPEYLIEMSIKHGWNKKESSCLVIFDEAGIPFNSRSWNDKSRLEWIKFLTQSRKFGYDFYFITQDGKMMDKQIRALCEFEVQHKKLNNMIYFKWLSLFRITLFAGVAFWNGLRNEKGMLSLYFYRKSVADRYDTLNLFDYKKDQIESIEVKEDGMDTELTPSAGHDGSHVAS